MLLEAAARVSFCSVNSASLVVVNEYLDVKSLTLEGDLEWRLGVTVMVVGVALEPRYS